MSKQKKITAEDVPVADRFVDVEKAIKSKNPRLLKWMPKFVLRYIKRTLHQDELNVIIYRNRHKEGIDFIDAGMEEMGIAATYTGLENIPESGGTYLTANHPLGGLDGVALMHVVGKRRLDMRFFVNDLLMSVKNFSPIFVPVNKHGFNNKEYQSKFEEVYSSDKCLLIFPAGLVSRRQKGRIIEDLIWKKSIIQKAIEHKRNIIPIHIEASNSPKFYNIAYWRKKIGIKANIEMFFLADEMFKQRGKTIHFTIGRPISYTTFTSDQKPEYWSQRLKEHVYSLSGKPHYKNPLPTIEG